MDIRTREAVRYLGYGRHAIDERTLEMIHSSFEELDKLSDARFIYRIFEIFLQNSNDLMIENLHITSEKLCKNLKNCHQAVLFAATLGTSVDRMIKKYTITNMAKAVVMQACAAAKLEEFCDQAQQKIAKNLGEGLYVRPRFSPGYGDFSILHQRDLLQMLDAPKKIGLTMTEASMLIPTKSVTAIIGISKYDEQCHAKGCESCQKLDCAYRRS